MSRRKKYPWKNAASLANSTSGISYLSDENVSYSGGGTNYTSLVAIDSGSSSGTVSEIQVSQSVFNDPVLETPAIQVPVKTVAESGEVVTAYKPAGVSNTEVISGTQEGSGDSIFSKILPALAIEDTQPVPGSTVKYNYTPVYIALGLAAAGIILLMIPKRK